MAARPLQDNRPVEPNLDKSDTQSDPTNIGSTPCFARSENIIVYVGADKAKYFVHQDILVSKSQFFETFLRAGIKEQHEGVVGLPEDDPAVFDFVVRWMYTGELPPADSALWHVYRLAEKLCMPDLENALIDAFKAKCQWCLPRPLIVMWAWKNLPKGSKFRELVFDQLCYQIAKNPRIYLNRPWAGATTLTPGTLKADLEEMLEEGGSLASDFFFHVTKFANFNSALMVDPSNDPSNSYHVDANGKGRR
ncbi:hypothetical protein ABEF95_016652 [Exophiala dermatitidis]